MSDSEVHITPQRLDTLEAVVTKATAGPWIARDAYVNRILSEEKWMGIADCGHPLRMFDYGFPSHAIAVANAEAIALLRNEAEALIAEVRRLRALIDRYASEEKSTS